MFKNIAIWIVYILIFTIIGFPFYHKYFTLLEYISLCSILGFFAGMLNDINKKVDR